MVASEALVFVAVREAALQRLFAAHPWLRAEVADAISSYARGISIDQDAIRETMSSIDPQDPMSMQQVFASGAFQPATTEEQQRALNRLELTLALVEGWVSVVTQNAIDARLSGTAQLIETMNRRRASGGPTEKTFENLVGLDFSPKLVRQASALWIAVGEAKGVDGRDGLWAHPDFMPTADDLDDVPAFLARMSD